MRSSDNIENINILKLDDDSIPTIALSPTSVIYGISNSGSTSPSYGMSSPTPIVQLAENNENVRFDTLSISPISDIANAVSSGASTPISITKRSISALNNNLPPRPILTKNTRGASETAILSKTGTPTSSSGRSTPRSSILARFENAQSTTAIAIGAMHPTSSFDSKYSKAWASLSKGFPLFVGEKIDSLDIKKLKPEGHSKTEIVKVLSGLNQLVKSEIGKLSEKFQDEKLEQILSHHPVAIFAFIEFNLGFSGYNVCILDEVINFMKDNADLPLHLVKNVNEYNSALKKGLIPLSIITNGSGGKNVIKISDFTEEEKTIIATKPDLKDHDIKHIIELAKLYNKNPDQLIALAKLHNLDGESIKVSIIASEEKLELLNANEALKYTWATNSSMIYSIFEKSFVSRMSTPSPTLSSSPASSTSTYRNLLSPSTSSSIASPYSSSNLYVSSAASSSSISSSASTPVESIKSEDLISPTNNSLEDQELLKLEEKNKATTKNAIESNDSPCSSPVPMKRTISNSSSNSPIKTTTSTYSPVALKRTLSPTSPIKKNSSPLFGSTPSSPFKPKDLHKSSSIHSVPFKDLTLDDPSESQNNHSSSLSNR